MVFVGILGEGSMRDRTGYWNVLNLDLGGGFTDVHIG